MEFLDPDLSNYIEAHTAPESSILKKLNRETHANVLLPRMLSGHFQGRVLSMISHMIKPMNILEIGTYTGYSALCLAEGLQDGGKIITIDINEELESMVRKFIKEAGLENKIDYRIGNALDVIKPIDVLFDIVFIDADKENYSNYYRLVFDKVRSGGYIIADNVLWSGKVVDPLLNKKIDKDTKAILDFNNLVHDDLRVENVLLPIRDGLMVLRKI
jgi:predicted O-methyltransferase YrrM